MDSQFKVKSRTDLVNKHVFNLVTTQKTVHKYVNSETFNQDGES